MYPQKKIHKTPDEESMSSKARRLVCVRKILIFQLFQTCTHTYSSENTDS